MFPHSDLNPEDIAILQYIITHVFCPLQLPDGDDYSVPNDFFLAGAVASAANHFRDYVDRDDALLWSTIFRMLDNLRATVQFESIDLSETVSQLTDMDVGDVLAYHIRAQNVAVIFRKQNSFTIFEAFEASPKAEDVMNTQGKLLCSYPGPAIEIPNSVFEDKDFLSELANFLVHMNVDVIPDAVPTSRKAHSTVREERDTTHPRYITELLTGILRSLGRPAEISRITKRVGDDVVWNNSKLPWRRSSLWLVIRVTIQTSLDQPRLGHLYKHFMLFFMCRLANEKICTDLSNDVLQFMLAKISRRLRKLGSSAPDWLSQTVLKTCTSLRSILEVRWKQVQDAQRFSPRWDPSQLDFSRDTELSLQRSSNYLRNCLAHHSTNPVTTPFKLDHHRRGSLDDFLCSDGAFFEQAFRAEPHVTLYDVEQAVEQAIDGWVDQVTDNDKACVKLEILGTSYSSSALKMYKNNPELLSVMLLTMIELWVALDKIAIRENLMLADYSPEISISLLEDLLLCKTASLSRLRRVHEYLSRRHSQSQSQWSVFSATTDENAFSVRYYRQSAHLQSLKRRIETAAQHDVNEKVAELKKENDRYSQLMHQAARIDHEYGVNWRGREYHDKHCNKCRLEGRYKSMQIAVHEWPLPTIQLHAEVVVFELDCPISFNMWRTATFHLLVDLCSQSSSSLACEHPYIQLADYDALEQYLVQHPRSRISLASNTKPFAVTHYSKTSIPSTQEQVCVNNGLKFYGFDSHASIAVSEAQGPFDIQQYCTYKLPCGPYRRLQKYIDTTSQTSNNVLANQMDCRVDLSIHEYIAFGHLRSGGLVQWLNILRELRGRTLSFRRAEVHLLLAQAVSQVGPLVDGEWAWHQETGQPSFCYAILEELEDLLGHVEANWLEGVTMDTISFLLRRLLASSANQAVATKITGLLRTVRSKVFCWVEDLSAKLAEAPGDEELRGFLRDTAAICRSTFNVDPPWIRELLHSPEDIKVLLASAILIHDHTPSQISTLPAYSQLLLDRNSRLSLLLERVLSDCIQADSSDQGIGLAVSWVWPAYRPSSKWIPRQNPDSRWFSCSTEETGEQLSQLVHFNLLNGSLLVNGKSLGRLPNEILRHPLYNLIFRDKVLDVIPGDLPGMDYSSRGMVADHQVYFSLRNDSDLVIRSKPKRGPNVDSDIIELIPQGKLEGDLPAGLIEGHAHWLNLSTSVIEIRPLHSLWEESSETWKMNCLPGKYRMQKGDEYLIDIHSRTWDMISALLRPFDSPQNLCVTASPIDANRPTSSIQLSVFLPRYGLSFYVDEDGDLQSRNMRGMVYDENQSIGTLFGLVNHLVLRPKWRDAIELIPRCILIPDGKVSFYKDGHHVCVKVNMPRSALGRITYQTYKVDSELGRLTGNVSLTNKLYRAYLHALTSGCGTDPLTGRLGTEEALSLLRSASCWSVMKFGSREVELLGLIASICPMRTWYPEHLRCMQRVEWCNLPASALHHDLYVVAKGAKEHYERVQSFGESQSSPLFRKFPPYNEHLLERSALRASYLFPSEFSGKLPGTNLNVWYSARDIVEVGSREQRAHTAATAIHRRTASADAMKSILNIVESWPENVLGDGGLSLRYDSSWLSPNLPLIWLKAYKLLRRSDESKWFQMLFSLPAMAYASSKLADLVPIFVAFALDPRFLSEDPPLYESYDLVDGYSPSSNTLRRHVSDSAHSFECSPESTEAARGGESAINLQKRRRKMYTDRLRSDTDEAVSHLLNSWPCQSPPPCSIDPDLYHVPTLTSNVQTHFASCYQNLKLKEHLTRVQNILSIVHSQSSPIPIHQYTFQPSTITSSPILLSLTIEQLFSRPAPSLQAYSRLPSHTADMGNGSLPGSAPLHQLIATVDASATNGFQRQYVSALCASAECFGSEISPATPEPPAMKTLERHYIRCRNRYSESMDYIKRHLCPRIPSEQALERAGQWPRITAYALFRSLASNAPITLPDDWRKCLVQLTLLALELQRARRLFRMRSANLEEELSKELQNEGCGGWDAEAHPDWLLVQLQGNFLIRRVQADVANEMISPRSGNNTAMQLNMGEGKSSVIVPVVVVVLADGDQLVRVIVPKALTAQMFSLLADRLGGLVNRRIYFLPFSRSLKVDEQKVATLNELLSECMQERGILVVQPEHILSLKLVTVEKQLPQMEEEGLACQLLKLQRWLYSRSRDILDESDEILHVRYQLVYTIGLQQPMEGFPDRWTTTEQVLGLVSKHASALRELFPQGVDYEQGPPGSFPHLRILHADAGQKLLSWIVEDVMEGRLHKFNFGQLRSGLRDVIRTFISCEHISLTKVRLVEDYTQQTPLWGGLLLLRGLLATGILLYAFRERRWRVDYGLAPIRTMLAVPYRAKDVPAQRAEFGHPDIAIILTCLSYYYGGLTEEQLELSFEILLKQDDPSLDYGLWVRECSTIPEILRTISGINIQSSEQWRQYLFPLFMRNRATVDFYLSSVVFPKEAKEFPSKLSCSGWDLAEKRERLVTGFSGTNDGQYLLPLHITQRDPDHQRGTNAKVLSFLLQPENNHYMCMSHENGDRPSTCKFLTLLASQRPEIRVLLDVGAQMLDLKNSELAKVWLAISRNASAAIYFNEDDELMVLTRDGRTHPLLSSPFAQQLDQCVVYLDDAHTRGTDMKFPSGYRAAVTLGPKVTKDRLAQGCMRMRKLGHGHSVMFFAPREIDRRIRSVAGKFPQDDINTMDILHWVINETCDDIQQRAPHWAQQGMDHTSRYAAWMSFCRGELSPEQISAKWLQPEAKKLEYLYRPRETSDAMLVTDPDIHQRCIELGILSVRDVSMDEEQEREVIHEAERERQVERAPRVKPATHSVHPDVVSFVKTGIIPTASKAFCRAFETLSATSAANNEAHIWSPNVLVTTDFQQTVRSSSKADEYLRPVMWVISGKRARNNALVISSPYEANYLLPHIRSSDKVRLHLYTPRTTQTMRPCDDLALYNIPTVPTGWTAPQPLMDQLNVFAGQLYLKDYETYIRLCRFLCVYARDLQDEEGIKVGCDGFISPNNQPPHLRSVYTFQTSPLGSLRTLMNIRRQGMHFAPTHMGKLLDGRLLSEEDFDECNDVNSEEHLPCGMMVD